MALGPRVLLLSLVLAISLVDAPHSTDRTAEEGERITLTCRAADPESVNAVEWNRDGLETEHVLLYKKGRGQDPVGQHPSYKDRVDLLDPQMKDGDVSLILKNVRVSDTGVYKCRLQRGSFEHEPICTINLTVPHRGTNEGLKTDGGTKAVNSCFLTVFAAFLGVLVII